VNTLFLVSKNFISTDLIVNTAKEIAVRMALNLPIESEPDYVLLQFFKDLELGGYFEIALYGERKFNQTKSDKDFKGEYGCKGSIDFDYDDPYLYGVLKSLLQKHPELLVYNELGNASPEHPFVFSKAHFDVAKDLYSLNQPPLQ
jgi:hypothetical protein